MFDDPPSVEGTAGPQIGDSALGAAAVEFAACVEGWNRCHGAAEDKPPAMTGERFDELMLEHFDWMRTVH